MMHKSRPSLTIYFRLMPIFVNHFGARASRCIKRVLSWPDTSGGGFDVAGEYSSSFQVLESLGQYV